jgi:hypothetical protein
MLLITQLLMLSSLTAAQAAPKASDGFLFNYCRVLPSSDKNLVAYWKYTNVGGISWRLYTPTASSAPTLSNAFRGTYKPLMIGQACSMDSVTKNNGIDPGCLANKLTSGNAEFWATCVKHPQLPLSPPTCQFGGNPRGFFFKTNSYPYQFPTLSRLQFMHDVRDISMMTCGLRTMPHFNKLKTNQCAKNVCQFWV